MCFTSKIVLHGLLHHMITFYTNASMNSKLPYDSGDECDAILEHNVNRELLGL